MKYSVSANDKTMELLAVPSFEKLPVERDDPVKFAKNLNEIISHCIHFIFGSVVELCAIFKSYR